VQQEGRMISGSMDASQLVLLRLMIGVVTETDIR
jgi:hypothetical protein